MADIIYDNSVSTVDVVLIQNPPDIINNDITKTDIIVNNTSDVVAIAGRELTIIETNTIPTVIVQNERGEQGIKGDKGDKGDQGERGFPGGLINPIYVTIPAANTSTIFEFDINIYRTLKYIITLNDNINNKYRSFEILILNQGGNNCPFVIYGIIGDLLQTVIDVQIINNNLTLTITNNEYNDLFIGAARVGSITIA